MSGYSSSKLFQFKFVLLSHAGFPKNSFIKFINPNHEMCLAETEKGLGRFQKQIEPLYMYHDFQSYLIKGSKNTDTLT